MTDTPKTYTDLREGMARAMCFKNGFYPDRVERFTDDCGATWFKAARWTRYLGSADAALSYLATFADIVPREATPEMLEAAAPFPEHLVIERNDPGYTASMKAAATIDQMVYGQKFAAMLAASPYRKE